MCSKSPVSHKTSPCQINIFKRGFSRIHSNLMTITKKQISTIKKKKDKF